MRSRTPLTSDSLAGGPSKPPSSPTTPSIAVGATTHVTVKGFYLRALLKELAEHGQHLTSTATYRDFADYPLATFHELLNECVQRLYPTLRRPEALRRVGSIMYPTLLSTMVGKVIFGSLGEDVRAVLQMGARGFDVSLSEGRYHAVRIGERDAEIEIRDFPIYPESLLKGVFEGTLAHYRHADATVSVKVLSAKDVDMHLTW